MHHLVREVRVRIETGKVLRLLTNDLTASAQEIADLYKQRWAIELFFRWVEPWAWPGHDGWGVATVNFSADWLSFNARLAL